MTSNKIVQFEVENFMGLEGKRIYKWDKIVALCQPNGIGKTSIIEALRFALTNALPKEEPINYKADSAYVKVTFENDESFGREISRKKSVANKYFYNDKKVSLKAFNKAFEDSTGVNPDLAKIISSADIIKGLDNQEFANLILPYLPEKLTVDYMLKKAEDNNIKFNEKCSELIKEYFGVSEFDLEMLNKYYDKLVLDRRDAKKFLKQLEAVYDKEKVILDQKPEKEKEFYLKELENYKQKRDLAIRHDQDVKNYEAAIKNQQAQINRIKQLEEQISKAPNGINHGDDIFKSIEDRMNEYRKLESSLYNNMQQCKNNANMLIKAVKNINSSKCPLSDKIVCTTDKSNAISDMQKTIEENKKLYSENKANYAELGSKVKRTKEAKEISLKEKQEFIDKQNMIKQLEQMKSVVAKKPEPVNNSENISIKDIDAKINKLMENIDIFVKIDKVKELEGRIEKGREHVSNLEILTFEFSPKGNLRQLIVTSYLESFSDICNAKAKELFKDMTIKFDADNGVKLLADMKGNGNYLPLNSLSGGERASVIFLIIDMLNTLSEFNIVILDELSILDKEVFANFIDIIKKYEGEYDMCIIASVDHDDVVETLKSKKIKISKVEDFEEDK